MSSYFEDYFFTSTLTQHVCPTFGSFQCQPPNACARDPNSGKTYCCDYDGGVCWTITSSCEKDGSTVNCGDGQNSWCCLSKTEVCTGAAQQINICWNSANDILGNISTPVLNTTYSSLSSSNPSSSSWAFDPVKLIAATQTSVKTSSASPAPSSVSGAVLTSSSSSSASPSVSGAVPTLSSSSSASPSVSGAASATASPTAFRSSSASISGGAIGAIVIGAIAVIVVLALGICLLKKRNRREEDAAGREYAYEGGWKAEADLYPQTLQELDAGHAVSELEASKWVTKNELSAS